MNRQELKERIINLPIFEKRNVYITSTPAEDDKNFIEDSKHYAICKVGGSEVYAYPGKGYNLIQFKEVFEPILDSIQDEVHGYLQDYGGLAILQLFPDKDTLKTPNGHIGLIAVNSVDMSSSVMVKFCIEKNGRRISIPPKVAGLKKHHTGNVGNIVKDYMGMVEPVKQTWSTIITEFPKYKIVENNKDDESYKIELGKVIEQMDIGKRLAKEIKKKFVERTANGKEYTLWDLFLTAFDELSSKKYKSAVHEHNRLDKLSTALFKFSVVLNI